MAISFPSSPVAGTSIYQGGRQWTYDGTTWNLVLGGAYELYWTHTGTGGETTLSGASDNGTTLTYPLGGENVYLNGVLLYRGQDYTATTGSTIVLANPLALSDIVTVVSYAAVQMSSNNIAQATEPTTYTPGMVWVNTAGNTQGLQLVRWKKTPTAGTTVFSGLADDGTTTLAYTVGYEEVYVNGILIVKGVDYTATNGTSITLTQATVTGDTVEVFNTVTMGVTNTYTQSQSDSRYLQPAGVGNDGQVPVSSYGATGGYVWQNQQMAGKNKIINGDFGIWQRGTSFSTPVSGAYLCDRFQASYNGTGQTFTVSQQAFTPGTAPVAGYESTYFMRYATTVAPSGQTFNGILQPIEDVRTFAGQNVTFSFWAKAASATTVGWGWGQVFGSGGSSSIYNDQAYTLNLTTSWQRFTLNASIASVAGKTIGSGSSLQFYIHFPLNSTFTVDTWGWQLEAGSVATPFSTASGTFQGELALCQRYFELIGAASGPASSSSAATLYAIYKVTKRSSPSITIQNGTSAMAQIGRSLANISSTVVYSGNLNSGLFNVTSSDTGMTTGVICVINADSALAISSEL